MSVSVSVYTNHQQHHRPQLPQPTRPTRSTCPSGSPLWHVLLPTPQHLQLPLGLGVSSAGLWMEGFNGGHSATALLTGKRGTRLTSFDIGQPFMQGAATLIGRLFGENRSLCSLSVLTLSMLTLCAHTVLTLLTLSLLTPFTLSLRTHIHSPPLVLVVMMKSKELKTKVSYADSLILSLRTLGLLAVATLSTLSLLTLYVQIVALCYFCYRSHATCSQSRCSLHVLGRHKLVLGDSTEVISSYI